MGIFARLAGWFHQAPPLPIGDLSAFESWMDQRGSRVVDAEQAARIATVHACWKVLAESIASLPCHLYVMEPDGTKHVAKDHPLNRFVSWKPGPRLTPFELFEHTVVPMCSSGRAIWQKRTNAMGDLIDLVKLHVELLKPIDKEMQNFIYQSAPGVSVSFRRDELWISEYFMGLSPLALMAEQIEQGKDLDDHANSYFRNGTVLGGALNFPGTLPEEEKKRLIERWNAAHSGSGNAFKVGLLTGGLTFTPYQIKNNEAQFLESRRFSKEEIASISRVPPHMVNDLTRATFSNVEHQDIAFVKHTLRPWLERIEQSMNRDLLSEDERETHYFAFNVEGLLRGDYSTRMNGYAVGIQNGILTANECRAWEDLEPKDGGDDLRFPMNARPGGVAMPLPDGGRGPQEEGTDAEV
jgi:HK97 family phage portal protein